MQQSSHYGPWNPGIQSQVPRDLAHLATIFRAENVSTTIASARELHGLTGFALSELVVFRPQRLALHELLVRVTADFAVPAGNRIEDLGLNFREIARLLLARYLGPEMDVIVGAYDRARQAASSTIDAALLRLRSGWGPEQIAEFERLAGATGDSAGGAAYRALARVMSALFATQGQAWGTKELIASMAANLACNDFGSDCIGLAIAPILERAAREHGYKLLPKQEHPVVFNTKGPSASGKSTLRPLLKKLAGDIGVQWSDFALISPDIWRKQLLDYASLGAAYKYAGAFTSDELQIVDQKLDRYMAGKHRRGEMSHLLIDSGIPNVFFTWVRRADKRIQFEFLDNTVQLGRLPRTVAFGDNETFNILDVKSMLDMERYARIDVDAAAAECLYSDGAQLAADRNLDFLERCVESFRWVNFADQGSGRVYLQIESGKPMVKDRAAFELAARAPDTLAAIRAVASGALTDKVPEEKQARYLRTPEGSGPLPTLGQWGKEPV
jgi:hypothetical protein